MLPLGQVYHFPSNSGRMHILKKSALMTQSFQKSVFGDTLNMNTYLITTKCTHTEITLLHITYEQLRLYLFVPDSSRHDYDQDEVIHLSWVEGKLFVFGSSNSYILPSVALGTPQRTPATTCAREETIRRCFDEGGHRGLITRPPTTVRFVCFGFCAFMYKSCADLSCLQPCGFLVRKIE